MNSKSINRNVWALTLSLCLGVIFTHTTGYAAEERKGAVAVDRKGEVAVDVVTAKSPAVSLKAVGKEVAPGVFEVDPNSIRGKRLMLPPSGGTARHICIGKWKAGECKGIYIEW